MEIKQEVGAQIETSENSLNLNRFQMNNDNLLTPSSPYKRGKSSMNQVMVFKMNDIQDERKNCA